MNPTIETTVQEIPEVMRKLNLPGNENVRIVIGSKKLAGQKFLEVAKRLQEKAARNGMTDEIHDELMASLKSE